MNHTCYEMDSNENMDEDHMELALNSNLYSELLDCWDKSPKGDNDDDEAHVGSMNDSSSATAAPAGFEEKQDASDWGSDSSNRYSFPSFQLEDDVLYKGSTGSEKSESFCVPAAPLAKAPRLAKTTSDTGSSKAGAHTVSSEASMDRKMPPSSEESSATFATSSSSNASASTNGKNVSVGDHKPAQSKSYTGESHLHPFAMSSTANCPQNFARQFSNYPTNPSLAPLAYNALAAGVNFANPLRHQPQVAAPTMPSLALPKRVPEKKPAPGRRSKKSAARQQAANDPPPFLLFDAPMELRANFMQSQRLHGIPVLEDNNSYHYGMAINGFHPQDHLNDMSAEISTGGSVRLIDGRHGDQGMKRLKNAKEQKRAQKITDLIEMLREKMETDGWNVGVKSKFHTLSSCADYVNHLKKLNTEKEEAIRKAQTSLDANRRKLDNRKEQQESSDPESSTSSLTGSSSLDGQAIAAVKTDTAGDNATAIKKRSLPSTLNVREDSKQPRLPLHDSSISSSASSGGDDIGNQGPGAQALSTAQASSVSDLTDSNNGCSSSNSGAEEALNSRRSESRLSTEKDEDSPSSGSVSSNAAVASVVRSRRSDRVVYNDVVLQGRKRKLPLASEMTSLEGGFELDYKEAFLNSNVPQVLATTSGRIIAWNDFFLRATGFSAVEMHHLTIFSLIQSNKLSSIFEIVAAALRSNTLPSVNVAKPEKAGFDKSQDPKMDFESVTLPCVRFQPLEQVDVDKNSISLNMTLTMLANEDSRKRCFHCIFTDFDSGASVMPGSISPELMALLSADKPSKTRSSKHNSSNKRQKKKKA